MHEFQADTKWRTKCTEVFYAPYMIHLTLLLYFETTIQRCLMMVVLVKTA